MQLKAILKNADPTIKWGWNIQERFRAKTIIILVLEKSHF